MEPCSLVLIYELDTHCWVARIRIVVINEESVALDTDLFDFRVRNGPIPIENKLLTQNNPPIKAI